MRREWISSCVFVAVAAFSARIDSGEWGRFIRGDVDDSGRVEMADAVSVLRFLFPSSPDDAVALSCLNAADANDDDRINFTDPIYLLNHLFRGGPAAPAPFLECGPDLTTDKLGCAGGSRCSTAPDGFGSLALDPDGLFFVIDRSVFMWGSGELAVTIREIARVISTARADVEFGIVMFSGGAAVFPGTGKPIAAGDAGALEEAVHFMTHTQGVEGACVDEGLLAGLALAATSTAGDKVLFYVGSGAGVCGEELETTYLDTTLKDVTAENAGRLAIYTIGERVRSDLRDHFLSDLATQNRGEYLRIDRGE
jgi:hypothetical protein